MPQDSKATLWANVLSLMKHRYGREHLTKFAADVGIGPGTATRIKEAETSVGLDVIERIALAFKIEPWQLMVPDLDVGHPPRLVTQTEALRQLYAKIQTTQEALGGYLEGGPHQLMEPPSAQRPLPDSGLRLTAEQKSRRAAQRGQAPVRKKA